MELVKYYKNDEEFNIRLEARLKNARLVGARELLGLTLKEAAKMIGISGNCLCGYENLKCYPCEKTQKKICNFYRDAGIFLYEPEVFPLSLSKSKFRRKYIAERTIPASNLITLSEVDPRLLPPVDIRKGMQIRETEEELIDLLGHLKYKELEVIYMKFFEGKTNKEIAESFGVSNSRIGQIEARAFRRLKHPGTVGRLIELAENYGIHTPTEIKQTFINPNNFMF